MNCDVTYEELAAFAAGDAAPERARRIRQHLRSCEDCRRRLKALASLDDALRLVPRTEPPANAVLNARRALSHQRRTESAPDIMTLDEVAEFLRVSSDDLEDVAEELPAFELGGQIRIRRARLIEWIQQRELAYASSRAQSEVAALLSGLF